MAKEQKSNNGANLGFESKLFLAADKLRGSMVTSEYKQVVLGLVFLKYISDAFNTVFEQLQADEYADEEDAQKVLKDADLKNKCNVGAYRLIKKAEANIKAVEKGMFGVGH
jgi:type I restriction-modification system DNA methylase subunit